MSIQTILLLTSIGLAAGMLSGMVGIGGGMGIVGKLETSIGASVWLLPVRL